MKLKMTVLLHQKQSVRISQAITRAHKNYVFAEAIARICK